MRYPLSLLMEAVPAMHLTVDNACLLLQDVHAPFWAGGWLEELARSLALEAEFASYYAELPRVSANLRALLHASREAGLLISYACLGYYPPGQPSRFQVATGWAWDLSGPLGALVETGPALPGEAVGAKPGWGALGGSQLAEFLEERGVRNVVLAGNLLEYGLRQTAGELAQQGFSCLVVADAATALSPGARMHAQQELAHGLVKVRQTAEYLELTRRLRAHGEAVV